MVAAGQGDWVLPLGQDANPRTIMVEGDLFYNSNVITNEFARSFYTGEFLDNELKSSVSDKLIRDNRFGVELHYGIKYIHSLDTSKREKELQMFYEVSNHLFSNAQFSEDLFNVAFYGNGMFEDDTAHLGTFSFNNLVYQQASVGIMDIPTGSYIAAGLINGQQFNVIDVSKGDLYTAPMGSYLDLDMNAEVQRSDTNSRGLGMMNGWGLGVDMRWNFELGGAGKDYGWYSISIEDLGFIAWNSRSQTYSNDTLFNYQGFELDMDNPSIQVGSVEDTLGIHYRNGTITTALPVKASFEKLAAYDEDQAFQTIMGVDHRLGVNYIPRVHVGMAYIPTPHLDIRASLAFGGYGHAQFQLSATGNVRGKFLWKIGSRNFVDSVLPSGRGMSLFTAIGFAF